MERLPMESSRIGNEKIIPFKADKDQSGVRERKPEKPEVKVGMILAFLDRSGKKGEHREDWIVTKADKDNNLVMLDNAGDSRRFTTITYQRAQEILEKQAKEKARIDQNIAERDALEKARKNIEGIYGRAV